MAICSCVSKTGLFVINLMFFGIGAGLIFLGSFMFREYARFGSAAVKSLGLALLPALLVVVVGILAVLLASIGCCATFNRKKCVKGMYFLMLMIMLMGLITGAAVGFVYRDTIDKGLHKSLNKYLNDYLDTPAIEAQVDLVQSELECCGVDGATDWKETAWYRVQEEPKKPYPESCCVNNACTYLLPIDPKLHGKGCYILVKESIKSHLSVIAGVAAGFAAMLLIGMILICVLMAQRRRKRSVEVPYNRMEEPYMVGTYTPTNGSRI